MSAVTEAAKAAGRAAGEAYRRDGTLPEPPSITSGSLLARQAGTAWHRGFAEGSRQLDMAGAPGLTSRSGMISLDLPDGTIKPVPGGLDDHHVTVVYLGPDLDDDAFAKACARAKDAAASAPGPLTGTVGGVDSFTPSPGSEGQVPAYAPITIPGAKALRSKLEDLSASEHREWIPHVTLAYVGKDDPLPGPVPRTSVKFTHLSVHRGDEVRRFPLGGVNMASPGRGSSGASNPAAPGSIISLAAHVELSALTPVLAVTPAPAGKPGGPGLWRVEGMELPPYFQNIRNALIRDGHSTADAYRITWGAIRRWARGGGNVHPEVRAAARKALADLAAKSAIAHADHANETEAVELAGAFTESLHPRIGGKFASKGGRPVAAARARHAPKAAAMPGRPVSGTMTRGQQMRYQAAQDRHVARQIMLKIAALVRERDKAIAGLGGGHGAGRISKPVNAARSAAARKAAIARKTGTAKAKTAARKTATAATPGRTRAERLDGQIRLLRRDARLLIAAADKLDRQASGL